MSEIYNSEKIRYLKECLKKVVKEIDEMILDPEEANKIHWYKTEVKSTIKNLIRGIKEYERCENEKR